jgi:flavin-dependent dehydrogenase
MLDELLAGTAAKAGVTLITNTRIDSITYAGDGFTLAAGDRRWTARMACGAWGKRSNVDVKMQRSFLTEKQKGIMGFSETRNKLEEISEKKGNIDEMKEKTLEEISKIQIEISPIFLPLRLILAILKANPYNQTQF